MLGNRLRVIGKSSAGRGFSGMVSSREAVRIFTGAPLPDGADAVLLQEDAARVDVSHIENRLVSKRDAISADAGRISPKARISCLWARCSTLETLPSRRR